MTRNERVTTSGDSYSAILKEIGFCPEVGKDAYLPEPVFYMLAMKAQNEAAIFPSSYAPPCEKLTVNIKQAI